MIIRTIRRLFSTGIPKANSTATSLIKDQQRIVTIFTVVGVWVTVISLIHSCTTVEQQLMEQRRATSVSIVNDFLTTVSEKIVEGKREDSNFQRTVVVRTQLLIDTLSFPELKWQIIKFLLENDFGYFFDDEIILERDAKEGIKDTKPPRRISLICVDLSNGNLSNFKLANMSISYSDLSGVTLNSGELDGANIVNADLSQAVVDHVSIKNSNIQWTNFDGITLKDSDLKDTIIIFSNLRNIKPTLNPNENRDAQIKKLVDTLKTAKSLYGSTLDKDVKRAWQKSDKESFQQLLEDVDVLFELSEKEFEQLLESLHLQYEEERRMASNNWTGEWHERRRKYCHSRR